MTDGQVSLAEPERLQHKGVYVRGGNLSCSTNSLFVFCKGFARCKCELEVISKYGGLLRNMRHTVRVIIECALRAVSCHSVRAYRMSGIMNVSGLLYDHLGKTFKELPNITILIYMRQRLLLHKLIPPSI